MSLFKSNKLPYTKPDRLADVMAMIQVLALHPYRHRSNSGLTDDLQGQPRSGPTWRDVAQEHPEFFRVSEDEKLGISLLARHVLPKDDNDKRELPSGFISLLLQTAINLHDRELSRLQNLRAYIPIIVAITAGVFTLFGIYLKFWLDK